MLAAKVGWISKRAVARGHKKNVSSQHNIRGHVSTTSLELVTGYWVTNNALPIELFSLAWPNLPVFG